MKRLDRLDQEELLLAGRLEAGLSPEERAILDQGAGAPIEFLESLLIRTSQVHTRATGSPPAESETYRVYRMHVGLPGRLHRKVQVGELAAQWRRTLGDPL